MTRCHVRGRGLRGVATALLVLTLVGCGDETTPSASVPELATQLDQVDDAIAARDYDGASAAIDALVDATTSAEESGDLDAAAAQRILDAAAALLAKLPATTPAESPKPSPTPTPTPDPVETSDPVDEQEEDDEDKDESDDEDDEKGKGNGKGKGKD